MESKQLLATITLQGRERTVQVELDGILPSERLTPRMARRALRIAQDDDVSTGTVFDRKARIGYRVYAQSARKLRLEE